MPTQPETKPMTEAEFNAYFDNFAKSAFRFETLPHYIVEGENNQFEHYMKTGEAIFGEEDDEWYEIIRNSKREGKTMQRVRYIPYFSDYINFELKAWPKSIDAGEEISYVDSNDLDTAEVKKYGDFWLFDDVRCAIMQYAEDGTFLGFNEITGDNITKYVEFAKHLKKVSKDIKDLLQ